MVEQAEQPDEHETKSCRFTFERWTRDSDCAGDVGGTYSRAAWLPVVGPTAWFIWTAVADRLQDNASLDCSLEELGHPWGFDPADVSWSLLKLARYGLGLPVGEIHWRVRTACPPLHDRLLVAAGPAVRAMHRRRLRPSVWAMHRRWLRSPVWAASREPRWGSGHLLSAGRQGLWPRRCSPNG